MMLRFAVLTTLFVALSFCAVSAIQIRDDDDHATALVEILSQLQAETMDAPAADSFDSMLNQFRSNIVEQQKISEAQAANETAFCNAQLKAVQEKVRDLNNTLLRANAMIANQTAQVNTLKSQVQALVIQLDPRVKELEGIVKTIQDGWTRRNIQQVSNQKKLNDTQRMKTIVGQLAVELTLTTSAGGSAARFRETVVSLQSQVDDAGLQRFLQTSLELVNGTNISSITVENVNKLRQLLLLLDIQLKDYIVQINSSEIAAQTAWTQVLTTLQNQRLLIQKEVAVALDAKQKAMNQINSLQKQIDTARDNTKGIPDQLGVLVPQLNSWRDQCFAKTQYYNSQAANRREQLETIDAVRILTNSLQNTPVQQTLDRIVSTTYAPASASSTPPPPPPAPTPVAPSPAVNKTA